ncbi:DMT family transporter [Priestia taiwanensis]|uniref:Membrane protein n=1 Tax=Priestia taiwanensis TaxID=1347902 RepID=A0A917ASG5_9BACI|nr:DMT family transporter [Priestia taiwanensis]MBM7364202.1 transporter family-2 protein [Priestia taiwanensis]GGE72476.1 membrane protein [Priestia taiwanensis]
MYYVLSIFIGICMAMMIPMNGILSTMLGNYKASVLIHLIGLLAIILVLFVTKSKLSLQKSIPIYQYSAGTIGVFTVLFISMSFTELGVSMTIALSLLGQSVSSIIIDHFGLLGMTVAKFQPKKMIGLSLIASGIMMMTFY